MSYLYGVLRFRQHRKMFSSRRLGLFDAIACPNISTCSRKPCIFSHQPHVLQTYTPAKIPITQKAAASSKLTSSSVSSKFNTTEPASSVPAKRPVQTPPSPQAVIHNEPPRKLQRLNDAKRAISTTCSPSQSSLVPSISDSVSTSKIPIPLRQSGLKTLCEAYTVLYQVFHKDQPHLARDHSLAQERDIYSNTNKLTYRQAIATALVSIRKRPVPDSPNHDNVGTEKEIRNRSNLPKVFRVEACHLECALLTKEQLVKWGYVVDIPSTPGGDKPTAEGEQKTCERCTQPFIVTPLGQGKDEACSHHWARPYTTVSNGEKIRTYKCCAMTYPGPGCTLGPHVFYERSTEDLHGRYPFSLSSEPPSTLAEDAVLDVAAIDCEMIYTTGGMHLARVSVVDGAGKQVFDELVRLSENVKAIDYVTRFSGVTAESLQSAVLDLTAIRQALRAYIGPRTILVGHALENDLKSLRMIHYRIIDTSVLFPHRRGAPYRLALRDLVSDKLQRMIQTAGSEGHSSVEDAIATLDLVRYWLEHVLPKQKKASDSMEASK